MVKINIIVSLLLFNAFLIFGTYAKSIEVSSLEEFKEAQKVAVSKDIISWLPGTYKDVFLNIFKDNITVQAKLLGKTIFTGASKVNITGDGVTFKGFQYVDGDIGSNDVIKLTGSHIRILEVNISHYKCYKYMYMNRSTQYNQVSKCNFETRINNIDKNIISIGVNDKQPGFHKIRYCSFKNFEGTGGDMGVEPIRIGSSTQAMFDSKTIVEYCYFTKCNGDGELISNKAGKNIFRYNTFEDNPLAELVLRHGNDTYVYGNFFIKGKGGVRIREGSNHYIFNNYFNELSNRSITLNSGKQNPIKNIYIMHNTFVNTAKLHLGGNKTVLPKKVVLANNLFVSLGASTNIGDATGKETWLGNMSQGRLGLPATKGIKKISKALNKNEFGFYKLESKSPVINSAVKSKIKLPVFEDLDVNLSLDILKRKRPLEAMQKDVGCLEFEASSSNVFKPMVTSENTGPSYNTDIKNTQEENKIAIEKELIESKAEENKIVKEEQLILDEQEGKENRIKKLEEDSKEVAKLKKQIQELQAKLNQAEKSEIEE